MIRTFEAMPLILDKHTPEQSRIGVWHVDEPEGYFTDRLQLSESELKTLSILSPVKRHEWLASRCVLDQIIDHSERIETGTLPSGKPILIGRKEEISLSHSDAFVAAMVGMTDVGIDIQRCKEKILQVEHKFANDEESARIDRSQVILHLHILWGAKEALYKIYARKQLNFRRHLFVDLPGNVSENGHFIGEIRVGEEQIRCALYYHILQNYVLVYGQKTS